MAFKQATIKELRKRFNPAGELSGMDAVIDIEDTNAQKTSVVISIGATEIQNVDGATLKDKAGNAIKRQVKDKYAAWAKAQGFADKDPVSTNNAIAIQTELGFNVISQIDNI